MTRFTDKNVLITGGTSGMGLAGALRVCREGGRVAVTGQKAERLTDSQTGLPAESLILKNDAGRETTGDELAAAIAGWGRLDGLWLNAGFATIGEPESITAGDFDRMMQVNVRGPMLQLAALSPLLYPGASVVITASSSVYEGAAVTSLYAATKGALVAMARSWATALAARNIRVNVLVPGPIDTGFRDFMPAEVREGFEDFVLKQVPLKRVGTPDEAAAVALFLLSDDASYVTGSQFAADGGLVRY